MKFQPVIYNVRKPPGRSFNATPHIGLLMPTKSCTIYCTFHSERISRIPDDGIYIYSIFQKELKNEKLESLNEKELERFARKIWAKPHGECKACLHLPVGFEPKRAANHERHLEASIQKPQTEHRDDEMHTSQIPSAEEMVN